MSDQDVITGAVATRYASALYELAAESKSLKIIEKDVATLKSIFAGSTDLTAMIANPVHATEDKVSALTDVARAAKVSDMAVQFVGTVAENRRSADLPMILSAFEALAAQKRGSQRALVTSAQKMTPAQLTELKTSLKETTGQTVEVETRIDPDLLGGFIVRIGSRLYDSSLKTKLEDLRIALKEV